MADLVIEQSSLGVWYNSEMLIDSFHALPRALEADPMTEAQSQDNDADKGTYLIS